MIPSSKRELRRDEGKGIYVVRQTFDSDGLPVVLEGVAMIITSEQSLLVVSF